MSYLHHTEQELRDAVQLAVDLAGKLGVEAKASARAVAGAKVSVSDGAVDSAVQDGSQDVSVTVYRDGRTGTASAGSLDPDEIGRSVTEADAIARAVQPDLDGGLADPSWLAFEGPEVPVYEPDSIGPKALLEAAREIDAAGSGADRRVTEAGAASHEGIWALATSTGFCRSSIFSNRGQWCMVMAADGSGSVVDSESSSDRRLCGLASTETVAKVAVERALGQRNAKSVAARRTRVMFEPRAGAALVGDLVSALTGASQHRRTTFLLNPIGEQIAASHLDLSEDPFEPFGIGSGAFDSDGIVGEQRLIVERGVATGLFLSARSAKQLNLKSTGNADGPYNLALTSREAPRDRPEMLNALGTGLLVTQLTGGATNPVTGGWTRAIIGFWVEDGEIAFAVRDATLAGDMKSILNGIEAVGADVERRGNLRLGSILIGEMQMGGAA